MSDELEPRAIADEAEAFADGVTGMRARVASSATLDDDDDFKTEEMFLEPDALDELPASEITSEPGQHTRATPPPAPPARQSSAPPRPPLAAWRAGSRGVVPPPSAAGNHARLATPVPDAPSDVQTELLAARSELARVASQMRARDAYLRELERALATATRQLATWGLGSSDDAARAIGCLRGQAFRIAELEADLQLSKAALAEVQATSAQAATERDDLQSIRGIGPRFETQLRSIGIASFERMAALSGEDIQRIAVLLRIPAERIDRDGWVTQARALCANTVE